MILPFNVYAQSLSEGIEGWELSFGLGVEQYKDEYIESGRLQGEERIVITEKSYETLPSAWLTINWNIWNVPGIKKKVIKGTDGRTINEVDKAKLGFFAGLKLVDSNSNFLSGFSLGPQISFLTGKKVITIGAGWVTHRTREYASGIIEGESLPDHYDDIVYREGTENSYMLMMSVNIF